MCLVGGGGGGGGLRMRITSRLTCTEVVQRLIVAVCGSGMCLILTSNFKLCVIHYLHILIVPFFSVSFTTGCTRLSRCQRKKGRERTRGMANGTVPFKIRIL